MIEARTENHVAPPQTTTPQRITISMILEDLENGTDRNGIKEKYNLEAWEVSQMFKHPALKGKKAKKVRKLSFDFVDDTNPDVLPGQVDLEDAIEKEMDEHSASMKDAMIDEMNGRQQMDVEDQITEMDGVVDEEPNEDEDWNDEEDDDNTEY